MTPETANLKLGDKVLVTVDNWFYAPDGRCYRAVFGTVKGCRSSEDSLGVRTNAKSTNWYLEVGSVTIAGCQIHYIVKCSACHLGEGTNWAHDLQHGIKVYQHPSAIFNADDSTNP